MNETDQIILDARALTKSEPIPAGRVGLSINSFIS